MSVPPNVAIHGSYSGSGATLTNRVTVSGNNQYNVFSINSGNVSIDGLAIANGHNGGNGGGIYNDSAGTATLTNVTVAGNGTNLTSLNASQAPRSPRSSLTKRSSCGCCEIRRRDWGSLFNETGATLIKE